MQTERTLVHLSYGVKSPPLLQGLERRKRCTRPQAQPASRSARTGARALSVDPLATVLKIFDKDIPGIPVLRELDRMDPDF